METTKGEGTLKEVAGSVQQAAGDLLGDAGMQASGAAKELTGKVQQLYADCVDLVRASTTERPFAALAIAVSVGFVLGALRAAIRSRPDTGRSDWRDRE